MVALGVGPTFFMRRGRQERGFWRAGRRLLLLVAVALCTAIATSNHLALPGRESWTRVTSALLVSPARADKTPKHRSGRHSPASVLGQWAAKQKSLKQLQQVESAQKQVQAAQQQIQGAQQQVQQIQATIKQVQAAQQQVQAIQQLQQQEKKLQRVLENPSALKGRHHWGTQHKQERSALASVASAPQPTPNKGSVGQYQARLQNALAKLKGQHQRATDGPAGGAGGGNHHRALLKAVAAKAIPRNPGTSGDVHARNETKERHQSRHQAAFQNALARLKGHRASGDSNGGRHEVRQQAVFRQIMSKLSGYRHRQEKQTATVEAPKATPAPAPTPAPGSKGTNLVSTLPATPTAVPNTSLLAQVSQVASQVVAQVASGGTSHASGNSEGAGLTGTISKLGGPQQPKQSTDNEPANSRTIKKVDDGKKSDDSKKSDDNDGVDNDARGLKRLGRVLGGRTAVEGLLATVGTFKPNEVLAINLSQAGLQTALANDYVLIGRTEVPGLDLSLTHLRTPEGQNAIAGRDALLDLVPKGVFSLNRVYAPYRMGLGMGGTIKAGVGCAADRCFGAGMINWQPQLATCARDVKIGIIDTGFDESHPAFEGLRREYAKFLPKNAKAAPQHGTAVLSLLAGSAKSTTPGLIPNAFYSIANAFYADASGQAISDTAHMLKALEWLKDRGVSVANLSFSGPEDELIHHAIRRMAAAGIVVVSAAGNDGPSAPPSYPAAYEEVIAVTAVDRKLSVYTYANRGAYIDVAAPGVGVWTALPGKREGVQTGTSFAVPYVTAVVAVDPPTGLNGDPLAPKRHALAMLQKNIRKLSGQGLGAGLVQAPSDCGAASSPIAGGWTTSTVHAVRDTRR